MFFLPLFECSGCGMRHLLILKGADVTLQKNLRLLDNMLREKIQKYPYEKMIVSLRKDPKRGTGGVVLCFVSACFQNEHPVRMLPSAPGRSLSAVWNRKKPRGIYTNSEHFVPCFCQLKLELPLILTKDILLLLWLGMECAILSQRHATADAGWEKRPSNGVENAATKTLDSLGC